jgi:hypothetical protein
MVSSNPNIVETPVKHLGIGLMPNNSKGPFGLAVSKHGI